MVTIYSNLKFRMDAEDFINTMACDVLKTMITEEVLQLEIPSLGGELTGVIDQNVIDSSKLETENVEEYFENTTEKEELSYQHEQPYKDMSYKKINSSKITEFLQIGIRNSIRNLSAPERDILMNDFMTVESTKFSYHDPNSKTSEFVFKTYAPLAFGYFRNLFGIKNQDFVISFCDAPLVELPNPGASGSLFYISSEDKFITKTVQQREASFLQKLLPGYFLNLNQNPDTLLPKFFGLYSYNCESTNVRMLVMNNILPYSTKIHQKYDLKGSKFMRKASEAERKRECPTYKDLDFLEHHPSGLLLDHEDYTKLIKSLQRDIRVLESFQIMDYSLLIGLTFVHQSTTKEHRNNLELKEESMENEEEILPKGDNENRNKKDGTTSKAENKYQTFDGNSSSPLKGIPAKLGSGEDVLVYVGIIDILQSYRMRKKIEHVLKSILHNSDDISVHNPEFYARRFLDFLVKSVFKAKLNTTKSENRKTCKI